MLEFIDKTENGYITIITNNDMFKYDDSGGKSKWKKLLKYSRQ